MTKINFMTEEAAKDLIVSEIKSNKEKGYIHGAETFTNHLIDTGRIGYNITNVILEKHPSLKDQINPDIIRVQGYVHDLTKIHEGTKYHEVGTAHLILTQGDTNLGLINGGTKAERRKVLREMASIIPPDLVLYEELGGNEYPDKVVYHNIIDNFEDRIEILRRDLSTTGKPLTMEEFALPLSLNQQIALYADLTNVNGEQVPIVERLNDLQARYRDENIPYNNPLFADIIEIAKPRLLVVANTIENLMK
ncbi:MAG: hypothetical protein ABH828_00960 [archaeon]